MGSSFESPFRYPKAKHIRRFSPPQYKDYRSYKRWVRSEFYQKCIYCHRPDSFHPNDVDAFAVEHYKPKKEFPEEECRYGNLYYACSKCNSLKGTYWRKKEVDPYIPNPCENVMMDHVRFNSARIEERSRHGGFMVEKLNLNAEELIRYRSGLNRSIIKLINEKKELLRLARKLKRLVSSIGDDARQDLKKVEEHVAITDIDLSRLCGSTLVGTPATD